jgi:hypothetical protein
LIKFKLLSTFDKEKKEKDPGLHNFTFSFCGVVKSELPCYSNPCKIRLSAHIQNKAFLALILKNIANHLNPPQETII